MANPPMRLIAEWMRRRRNSSRCSRRLIPGSSARCDTADLARSRMSSMVHYGLCALWLWAGMVRASVPLGGERLGVNGVRIGGGCLHHFRRRNRHTGLIRPVRANRLPSGGRKNRGFGRIFHLVLVLVQILIERAPPVGVVFLFRFRYRDFRRFTFGSGQRWRLRGCCFQLLLPVL